MNIGFVSCETLDKVAEHSNTVVLTVTCEEAEGTHGFEGALKEIDEQSGGTVTSSIKAFSFDGKKGEFLTVTTKAAGFARIILAGLGKADGGDDDGCVSKDIDLQNLGGKLQAYLEHTKAQSAAVIVDRTIGGFAPDFVAAHMAYGASLRGYSFDKYFVKKKDKHEKKLKSLTFAPLAYVEAQAKFERLAAVRDGVFFARDLISEPSNVLYPESYADICKDMRALGLKVDVLGEKEMKKLGMNALLGVGQGSERESHLVVMQWQGAGSSDAQPIAFVGKGVTFDTGGISIKPSANMEEMKYDMGGSGAVVGLMRTLALRKARVNAVGVIGLVENMPDGNAQRPGDVVTTMSGQTVEVLNTDAEGRLVLADALYYTCDKFSPRLVVDVATLTGAIVVTLGGETAGLFSNDDALAQQIYDAGEAVEENVWRLPLSDKYDTQIDSKIADMQNIGNTRGAGSITAAQFLKRFVGDTPWAHVDIAGVAWAKKAEDLTPEGARGFGVRLLNRFVADNCEE